MSKKDMTMIRLRKTTLKKLRGIGNRDMTDDQVVEMMSDYWNTCDEVTTQTIMYCYNREGI
jgi:hypothetical protein